MGTVSRNNLVSEYGLIYVQESCTCMYRCVFSKTRSLLVDLVRLNINKATEQNVVIMHEE